MNKTQTKLIGFLSANPSAIELLEQNPDKIDWGQLSRNQSAMHLLKKSNKNKLETTIWKSYHF